MKALLAALMLAVAPAAAAPAPAPVAQAEIVGLVGFEVDEHLEVLVFVFSNGSVYQVSAQDCLDSPDCRSEVAQLVAIKRVKVIDVKTGTKV